MAAAPVSDRPPPRAALRWLRLSPHRAAFLGGAVMLALSALWWLLVFALRAAGVSLPWAVAPGDAHALVMSHGFMPLFFLGFLCTGAPRWIGRPPLPGSALLLPVAAMLAGWACVLAGAPTHAGLAAAGLACVAAGQALAVLRFVTWTRAGAARAQGWLHPWLIVAGLAAGIAALAAAALALAAGQPHLVRPVVRASLWASHGLVFTAAAHRLVPYLAAGAWPALQERWPAALPLLLGVMMLAQAPWPLVAAAGPGGATGALDWVRGALGAGGAGLALALAWHWARIQSLRLRLPAMLHAGLLWLALAWALQALAALGAAAGLAAGASLAAVHALTLGFMGSVMLAMVTRVACAQHGRTVVVDRALWVLFCTAQLAAAARVAGAWIEPLRPALGSALAHVAAVAWSAVALGWALRYGRWFVEPAARGPESTSCQAAGT